MILGERWTELGVIYFPLLIGELKSPRIFQITVVGSWIPIPSMGRFFFQIYFPTNWGIFPTKSQGFWDFCRNLPATKTPLSGPVDEELARRFLRALNSEYVEQQEGADPWTRWWFQIFHTFIPPLLGEDEPNLTSIFFHMGWFNHQPVEPFHGPMGTIHWNV